MALRSAIVRVKRQRDEAACPELGEAEFHLCMLLRFAKLQGVAVMSRALWRKTHARTALPTAVLEATTRHRRAADLAQQLAGGMGLAEPPAAGAEGEAAPDAGPAAAGAGDEPRAAKRCRFMRVATRSAVEFEVRAPTRSAVEFEVRAPEAYWSSAAAAGCICIAPTRRKPS
jgi:hypothetical protein